MVLDKDTTGLSNLLSVENFSRNVSPWSDELTTAAGSDIHSRQCSEIDVMANRAILEGVIEEALKDFVAECSFCVTIADPRKPDFPLIAVSDQFEAVTGYSRHEILGKNCRFLNEGCEVQPKDLMQLRRACATGAPFAAVLANRKKAGQIFMNLLDLRGLFVAQNPSSGEYLWFLVGIQADVTNVVDGEVPENHLSKFHQVAEAVRIRLTNEISIMALSEAVVGRQEIFKPASTWVLLAEPTWHECRQEPNRPDLVTDDEQIRLMKERKMKVDKHMMMAIVGGFCALSVALSFCKVMRPAR